MNNNRDSHRARPWFAFIWLAAATANVCILSALHAQCPNGNDPDSPGCAVASAPQSQQKDTPASVKIDASSQSELPYPGNYSDTPAGERPLGVKDRTEGKEEQRRRLEMQAEAPTEFQRFVAASTGQTFLYSERIYSTRHPPHLALSIMGRHQEK